MPVDSQDSRPDPDALLSQVQADEAKARRGKLKVFFGASAGVGKTYAMLSAGRAKTAEGADVVVGYAEPHIRPQTEMLLLGMDILPYRMVEYRSTQLKEFDLDAALARKPELILVDELAHTNAPGSRHAKRWQDIEELLAAGIGVYTTLNVQHLESLNDVVAQITGVVVQETLPDAVMEKADEVELVDLPPEELLERLAEGKVYIPEQALRASQGFFRKGNLTALRELALRQTAERVGAQVETQRQGLQAARTWPTGERLLVAISPSPGSAKVIRAAKRLAAWLHAEWIVAHVETPGFSDAGRANRDALLQHFRLAERLGAQTVTLSGLDPIDEVVSYARDRNVTKIVAGKSDQPWWKDLFLRSYVDRLLRKSGEIDVYVVRGIAAAEPDEPDADSAAARLRPPAPAPNRGTWARVGAILLACTAVAWLMFYVFGLYKEEKGDLSNLSMVYLVGVVIVAARYGRWPSVVAALLSVGLFDYLFVPKRFSFGVNDTQYIFTFIVMLGVAALIGTLTVRIREQADASRKRERQTASLYRMTQRLAGTTDLVALAELTVSHLSEEFHGQAALLLPGLIPGSDDKVSVRAASNPLIGRKASETAVAQWVFDHRQIAGQGTDTLPAAECLYLPLVASRGVVGVLGIQSPEPAQLLAPEQRQLLDAFLNQIALAVDRHALAQAARQAQVEAEAEKMRSSLLSSVSHDLRTPLAVIAGASSSLLEGHAADQAARDDLAQTIHVEAQRLSRLVSNLLDITRLESGGVRLNRQWHPLEEVVGSALTSLESQLADRPVRVRLAPDLPLVFVDGLLLEQVFINLVENAIKYTPSGAAIDIAAQADARLTTITVADSGPGVPAGEERLVFDKFYRGTTARPQRGAGLGLAICRAIIDAHGGQIGVANRIPPEHGAAFTFTIPNAGPPPKVDDPSI